MEIKKMKTLKFLPQHVAFLLLSGLAQSAESGPTITLPPEDRAEIENYLGAGVVGEAVLAPEIIDTALYLAANTSPRTFRLVSGPDAGQTVLHQPTLLNRQGGVTTWRYDAGGKFIYFLTAKANGDFVMTSVQDTEAGAITDYSPSEPFMLNGLTPGAERNMNLGLKVFALSDPSDLTHQGNLNVNYRYMGAYKVNVLAGSFDAVLIKWSFNGNVGPATVNDTQYRFFAPGVGIVAGIEQLDVSALFVYNRHNKVARVLVVKPN
jgi:hypothetical protein